MHALDASHAVRVYKRGADLAHLLGRQTAVLGLLLFFAASLHAQFRTSIQGTVTDPTGAVIPGATLTLTDTATNQTITHTSDADGIYNFNALAPDHFTLTAEKEGFNKKVLDDLQLIPEQPNSVNIQLEVGNTSQSVTVNASTTPVLDTETANNGQTLSDNEIQHLPAYERDVTSLVQLTPGVIADGSHQGNGAGFQAPGTQTGASSGGGGNLGQSSSIFATENGPSANTNGGQFENNGFAVDGISTVSAVWGGATVITPSEDSVANVRILSNNYDAENGRFAGAMTQITTKSGSNQIHGSFFWQFTRPGLNAYQRWNGPQSVASVGSDGTTLTPEQRGLTRDTNRYNQLGGSVGGPLWKNRVFAFFSMESQNQTFPQTGTSWYTTSQFASLAPANSIASTFLNFPGASVLGSVIASVTCADAGLVETVNCNTIAGQGLNIGSPLTTALGTQDLTYVSNTTPGVGGGLPTSGSAYVADIAQYSTSIPTTDDFKQYYGRADANVTNRDLVTFTIYWVPSSTTTYNGGLAYDLFNHDQVNDAFTLIWNHTFSPDFLNEARANAAGWRYNELESNPQEPLGLPQAMLAGSGTYGTQIGSIDLGRFGPGYPGHLNQWTYTYKDVATKVLHSHTVKFGADLTRLYYLNVPISIPNYTFYNIWAFLNDAPEAEGGSFQATTGLPGGYRNDNRENIWGAFVQDQWKFRPGRTISAGLRYSYFGPITDKNNNMGVLDFGAGDAYLTGIRIRTGIDGWTAQKLNFGPQFGFNWNPPMFAGMVVRGGYGLNFNEEQIANANAYDYNPPGTSTVPGSSTSPTNINPNIVYAVSSSPTSYYGYPPNPYTITTFNSAGLPTAGGANLNALPGNLPTQYYQHYSLQAEYSLPYAMVASLGYMGSVGRHLMFNYDSNAFGIIRGDALNPLVTSINTVGSNGFSMNNMMVLVLKHQFSHTFSAEGQFTWAHSEDTNSGPYSRSAYLYNPHYAYGRSDFDINRYFKLFGVWQPVFMHGGNSLVDKIAGGWTLSGIMTLHSGFGWTPVFNAGSNQIYCQLCNYGGANLRPTYLGGAGRSTGNDAFKTGSNFSNPGAVDTGTSNNLFSDNYFSVPDLTDAYANTTGQIAAAYIPPPGIGRNSFAGPGYRDVDFTFGKAFGLPNGRIIGEHAAVEIKANMWNAFNLLNINPSQLSTNIANSNLGQASGALGARIVDFQARFSF